MKKPHLILLLFFQLFCFFGWTQTKQSSFGVKSVDVSNIYEPDLLAKQAVSVILKYTGLEPNIQVLEKPVTTAAAYIQNGQRYIAYNRQFIYRLRNSTKTDWAAVSVLAHEIGHHLLGHTLRYKHVNPGNELAADKFSGFILFQMGASLAETKAALSTIGHDLDTVLHPGQNARLEAVIAGFMEAKKLQSQTACFDEIPADNTKTYKYICEFKKDENKYFVDDKNNIIWHDNYGEAIVIGRKIDENTNGYAWLYQYQGISYGVDFLGNIWLETSHGSAFKVGSVSELIPTDLGLNE